jgi:hypothetical protein
MDRRFQKVRSLTRNSKPKRDPKPEIILVCEGKVTEPRYFNEFSRICGNPLVKVTTIGGCGVPLSVVERAVQEYDCRIKKKNKSTDSFEIFEVWAVFDRDAHPEKQVPNAFKLAATNNIFVAFSNPCFEVWGLMHFSCFGKPGHHHEAQAVLKSKLPSYCHTKNPYIDALALHNRYSEAVRNSIQALDARKNEQNMNGDPSTTVHQLTERITSFGKK